MRKWCALLLSLGLLTIFISCSPKLDNLQVGDTIHGFKLIKKEFIQDQNSTVYLLEHVKTGAKLVNMKNDDINRVFAIAFNTFPHDSTGKAHILEHSLLMGSKNFPSKDTFEELKKGSFSTYLNAFTSADMTTYPVATINSKEFKNLMHVYLDAVFFPNIHTDPNVMKQEGIRLEYDEKNNRLDYKGVVFNEMKGVLGKPESIVQNISRQNLFPNTTYANISGGDPKIIPELTQESLTSFHKQFYHPSNSYTFIYGDEDISEHLKFIDQNYFSTFEKKEVLLENRMVAPIYEPTKAIGSYGIAKNESLDGKYFYSKTYIASSPKQTEDNLGLGLLSRLLTKNQTSPLAKALIDAGLGTQVYSYRSGHLPWTTFVIAADKTDAKKMPIFEKVVQKTLEQLAETGFDPDVIEGEIRNYEFSLKEMDVGYSPMGIEILGDVTRALAFDLDLFEELRYVKKIEELKKQAQDKNYFQNLIRKYLLNNKQTLLLEVQPVRGLTQKEDAEERAKLDAIFKAMTPKQIEDIKAETKAFADYQNRPSKDEDIKAIPKLSLSDIDKRQESIPQEIIAMDKSTVLYHPLYTKGITYIDLNFDMMSLTEEQIPYASLLIHLLENLSTKNKTLEQLQREKALHTGFAYNRASAYDIYKKDDYTARFKYTIGTLDENVAATLDFIHEIVVNTNYRDFKELKQYLQNVQSDTERQMMGRPGDLATSAVRAMGSAAGAYNFRLTGYPFYWFVRQLNRDFDSEKEMIAKNLQDVALAIFQAKDLVIGVTADASRKASILEQLKNFASKLPKTDLVAAKKLSPIKSEKLGIIVPGKVQYVVMGGNLPLEQKIGNGSLDVLMQILENEFLHPEIRQKGGAYGAYSFAGLKGDVTFMSYRDPNLARTLDIYRQVPSYLQAIKVGEAELEKYIIGTVKDFDTPKSNKQKGAAMTSRYLFNYTLADRAKFRSQIIHTAPATLQSFGAKFSSVIEENKFAVSGSEETITQNAKLFDRVIQIFE